MNERRRQIIASARRLVGTPFHHQGRLAFVGVDCVGVLVHVASELGLEHRDYADYKRVPSKSVLSSHLEVSGCSKVALENAEPGDILTFWYQVEGLENHVAVLSKAADGRSTLIHAYASAGGVVEHDFDAFWRERVMNAWRFPKETV